MSFLTGSPSSSTSSSSNVNNSLISGDYAGQIANGTNANSVESSLLTGSGNTAAANADYQNYLSQAGYGSAMTQLSKNITGQGAAAGLLNSGSSTEALANYGTQLNNQYYQNYLSDLSNQSSQGTTAGSLVAGTGQVSSGSSTGSSPGILATAASAAGGIANVFSDRRLKKEIVKIGEEADGLGIYSYRYKLPELGLSRMIGVMADEVAKLRPWALGPVVSGFATVNYGKL